MVDSLRSRVSPEARIVTLCCMHDPTSVMAEIDTCARLVKDWGRVVELAQRHRVAAVILPQFEDLADRGAVQSDVVEEIRGAAFSDIAVTARLRVALKEILSALGESSVDVIVLKGAALSSLIYDDQSVRPSDDIDLLCKEDSYERVWDILVKLGYETDDSPSLPHRHSQEETYFERHFYHPDGFVHVELHVDDSIKTGVRPQLAASQWTRVRSIQIDGSPALMLGLEDQVVMLSVHLHRHGFNRLMWFKDIDLLLRRYGDDLDWEMVLDLARRESVGPSLWYTFRFLREMLDTPVPEEAMSALKPGRLVLWTYNAIWPEAGVLDLRGRPKRRALQFSIHESWRGTIPSLLLMGRRREKIGILLRRLLRFRGPDRA
ncbi:MAG: nucleotidyltransferase family protein [Chloroflexi bacterium]|nr:nucleotidyltransferase family protein [Chloroflexota bacterium]